MPTKKRWMPVPPKPSRLKPPDNLKMEVQQKADQFAESYLKPTFILPPPEDAQWNYVVDIFTKWHQRYFYFCSKYCCPHPSCISEFFESRFARLEYVGGEKFNISYMRHTGQWLEVFQELSLEECLEEIRRQEFLHP